ncbi:polyphenol oxidase family protein [Auritidibacter ignavus]|uniref:polyphenol oxidase family protein n=1 Tax=Auritidibacter ignavus TaxID=678932 RepID=UPI00109C49B5|nr:polyphenol oxidase family protein [Auritidibacter ignavus]
MTESAFVETYRSPSGHTVGFSHANIGNLGLLAREPGESIQDIYAHRRAVEKQAGIAEGTTVFLHQVHSATVVEADELPGWSQATEPVVADASISATGATPLAILVADCMPVVFTTSGKATAVAHAGRVGLLSGVLQNTIATLREHEPEAEITAWIGPSICGRCYEVPEQMRSEASAVMPVMYSTTSWQTPALDLPAAGQQLMEDLGVTVHRTQICTLEDSRVFSHRGGHPVGRCAGMVFAD